VPILGRVDNTLKFREGCSPRLVAGLIIMRILGLMGC